MRVQGTTHYSCGPGCGRGQFFNWACPCRPAVDINVIGKGPHVTIRPLATINAATCYEHDTDVKIARSGSAGRRLLDHVTAAILSLATQQTPLKLHQALVDLAPEVGQVRYRWRHRHFRFRSFGGSFVHLPTDVASASQPRADELTLGDTEFHARFLR